MDDVDELFNAFEEKKQRQKEQIENIHQGAQDLEEHAAGVLSKVVLPVIESLCSAIQQKGHKAEFRQDRDYIEFNFTPTGVSRPALLLFHHNGSGRIAIIQTTHNASVERPDQSASLVPLGANPEWIRSRILDFVKLVLEIN